jgi:hypothetical protein
VPRDGRSTSGGSSDLDVVLSELEKAVACLVLQGAEFPSTRRLVSRHVARLDGDSARWPRSWRRRPGDVVTAKLQAYYLMNVMERSVNPGSSASLAWAQIGEALARHHGWTAQAIQFSNLKLLAVSAGGDDERLEVCLRQERHLLALADGHPEKIEYLARLTDMLQLQQRWDDAATVSSEIIRRHTQVGDITPLRAARHLQHARNLLHAGRRPGEVERALDQGTEVLAEHAAEAGTPHQFFENARLCILAEVAGTVGNLSEMLTLLAVAEEEVYVLGLPSCYLDAATGFARAAMGRKGYERMYRVHAGLTLPWSGRQTAPFARKGRGA